MPLLNFDRVQVELALVTVHIQQHLGGFADGPRRVHRVVILQHSEVGNGLHIVEVRAGEPEKVAQHAIAVPVHREIGETVEQVVPAAPHPLDGPVNTGDEALETLLGVQLVDFGPGVLGQEGFVPRESKVNQALTRVRRRPSIGFHERPVVADRIDLPDHVIPRNQPVKDLVQGRKTGGECHRYNSLSPARLL